MKGTKKQVHVKTLSSVAIIPWLIKMITSKARFQLEMMMLKKIVIILH